MNDKILIVVVTAAISALVTFLSTIFLENRRNSIKQAREINPNYFRQLHRRTVLLRESIQGFGSVWDRAENEYDTLTHDLYRILVAKIEDFNRELSVATNEDVFLLPEALQEKCEGVRSIINEAAYSTDIKDRIRVIAEYVDGSRIELQQMPDNQSDLSGLRYFETKRKPSLRGSAFCNPAFRRGLIDELRNIESKIKRLAVN